VQLGRRGVEACGACCGAGGNFFSGVWSSALVMIGGVWRHEVLGGVMVGEHEGDGDDFGKRWERRGGGSSAV
jgi:hypothetical protein